MCCIDILVVEIGLAEQKGLGGDTEADSGSSFSGIGALPTFVDVDVDVEWRRDLLDRVLICVGILGPDGVAERE